MSLNAADKIKGLASLKKIVQTAQKKKKTIVFTNGCFDIIHLGHVRYLEKAKQQGDLLVVGVNADSSIRKLKGPGRPLMPERDRAEILAALACVDWVVLFKEDTPHRLLRALKPDILVKGGDYATIKKIVGYEVVLGYGGKVKPLTFLKGRNSSALIEKVKRL